VPSAVINGVRLNYVQVEPSGSGCWEDLVMVHGLATSLAFWYLPYSQVFAKHYRVTLFDLRGHGRSERTPSGYTPATLSADLHGLLDHLNIRRAHFVAHSFGGVVTLGLARLAPERIASLVLADTQISSSRGHTDGKWARREMVQAVIDRHGLGLDTSDPYFGFKLLSSAARLVSRGMEIPAEIKQLAGPIFGSQGGRTAKQWLELMNGTQAEDELTTDDGLSVDTLRSFRFPTLALYGDQSLARPAGEALHRLWPHAHYRALRDAGHFFPITRSGELISACERFWGIRHSYTPFGPVELLAAPAE
jgi:pimeloyl-ACP methyl ester carboxylesterase